VQRRTLVAAVLVAVLVILAGSWFGFAGEKGLTPVPPASIGAEGIDDIYLFIGIFAAVIFLSVTIPLALIVAWYRERGLPRDVEGPQIRGNTRLELTWTAIPIVIVLIIVAFTLYKAPGIDDPGVPARGAVGDGGAAAAAEAIPIRVEGRQFYWRYVYENGAVAIDTLRIPVDREVDLEVTAPESDVIHSFWVPALGGKVDAIPGIENHLRLAPSRTGVFGGRCAELCGIQHTFMNMRVEVLEGAEFDSWLDRAAAEQGGDTLGKALWEGVCAKCHFAAPEFAPNIIGNPTLGDPERLEQLVTEGRGRMPAVGRGWTAAEHRALAEYVRQFAPAGETNGG
jgi:cytochrome c oxidase subunit II